MRKCTNKINSCILSLRHFTIFCATALISSALVSCEFDDDDYIDDNPSNAASDSLGFYSVELELPRLSKFENISEHTFLLINLMGEDDRIEYIVPMKITNSDEDSFSIQSCSIITESMPYQRYYLNELLYNSDVAAQTVEEIEALYAESQLTTRSLGAIVSMEDADNIYMVSSIDSRAIVGSGASNDPYIVSSYDDLYDIYIAVADSLSKSVYLDYHDEYFMMTCDVDMTHKDDFTGGDYGEVDSWIPIGSPYTYTATTLNHVPFRGTFDGNGFSICNMYSNITGNTSYNLDAGSGAPEDEIEMGLFYSLGTDATIKNVNFISTILIGDSNIGTIASMTESDASNIQITDVHLTGIIAGKNNLGGFVGSGGGITFNGCTSSMSISNNSKYYYIDECTVVRKNVGGFMGNVTENVSFTNCSFSGAISHIGLNNVGGMCGRVEASASFSYCGIAGSIGGAFNVGGVIGLIETTTSGLVNFSDVIVGGTYRETTSNSYEYIEMGCVINASCNTSYSDYKFPSGNEIASGSKCGIGGIAGQSVNGDLQFFGSNCTINNHTYILNSKITNSGSDNYSFACGGVCGYMTDFSTISGDIYSFAPQLNYEIADDAAVIFGLVENLYLSHFAVYLSDDISIGSNIKYLLAKELSNTLGSMNVYNCSYVSEYSLENVGSSEDNTCTIEYHD